MNDTRISFLEGIEIDNSYIYRSERIISLMKKYLNKNKIDINILLVGDLFYVFYLPFPVIKNNVQVYDERSEIFPFILNNSKIWKIKAMTVADVSLSMVAVTVFISSMLKNFKKTFDNKMADSSHESRKQRRGLSRALTETLEAVKNAASVKAILEKMGAGDTSSIMFEDSIDIILELSKRTDIREIERILAGIEVSRVYSRNEVRASRGWISGFELGGDLERVHPSRLALPEGVFIIELLNSRLLLYEKSLYGEKGNVYVLLDKSGSMSGDKINWARAVAIALLIKARSSRRGFYLRYFDSITHDLIKVYGRIKTKQLATVLKNIATVKASGGTNITNALAKAVDDLDNARGFNDIVLITDGEDKLSYHIIKSIIKRKDIKLHTIMIKGENPTLQKVSETYMVVERLSKGEGLKVVRKVFASR